MNPNNTILEIWKSLPYNYKMTYNLLDESIQNGFIDIFEILCAYDTLPTKVRSFSLLLD